MAEEFVLHRYKYHGDEPSAWRVNRLVRRTAKSFYTPGWREGKEDRHDDSLLVAVGRKSEMDAKKAAAVAAYAEFDERMSAATQALAAAEREARKALDVAERAAREVFDGAVKPTKEAKWELITARRAAVTAAVSPPEPQEPET